MKPILFSNPMVQAILNGTKTQTRRIISQSNSDCVIKLSALDFDNVVKDGKVFSRGEYLKVFKPDDQTRHRVYSKFCIDDILWVRETWQYVDTFPEPDIFGKYLYKSMGDKSLKWKPSIFMPKEACRIFLMTNDIRVQRLQDISEEDSIAEGVSRYPRSPIYGYKDYLDDSGNFKLTAKESFQTLWQKINGKESWDLNPWIWVIDFERTDCPAGFC